jgi:hypothetical protein
VENHKGDFDVTTSVNRASTRPPLDEDDDSCPLASTGFVWILQHSAEELLFADLIEALRSRPREQKSVCSGFEQPELRIDGTAHALRQKLLGEAAVVQSCLGHSLRVDEAHCQRPFERRVATDVPPRVLQLAAASDGELQRARPTFRH